MCRKVPTLAKGCEKMLELDQIKYEMPGVRNNLKELGESL